MNILKIRNQLIQIGFKKRERQAYDAWSIPGCIGSIYDKSAIWAATGDCIEILTKLLGKPSGYSSRDYPYWSKQ